MTTARIALRLRLFRRYSASPAVVNASSVLRRRLLLRSSLHYAVSSSVAFCKGHVPIPISHINICRLPWQKVFSSAAEAIHTPLTDTVTETNLPKEDIKIVESNTIGQALNEEKNTVSELDDITELNLHVETMAQHQEDERGTSKFLQMFTQLEKVVERQGQSIVSLSSQIEEYKQLFASILQDIKLLKADHGSNSSPSVSNGRWEMKDHLPGSSSTEQTLSQWSEWTSFLDHLKGLPLCADVLEAAELGASAIPDDKTTVKRTLSKFSQAYENLFEFLSTKHLQALAEYGCPIDDRRAIASAKRLQDHFEKEGQKKNAANVNPKLSDVIRLIYTIVEAAASNKCKISDPVKLSISQILKEIISMTSKPKHKSIVDAERFEDMTSQSLKVDTEEVDNVEAKVDEGGICNDKVPVLSDKWKCARCFRLNRPSESKCVDCGFLKPEINLSDADSSMQERSVVAGKGDTEVSLSNKLKEPKADVALDSSKSIKKVPISDKHTERLPILDKDMDKYMKKTPNVVEDNNMPGKTSAENRQEVQMPFLSEDDEVNPYLDGNEKGTEAHEHSKIFDDILDPGEYTSSRVDQMTGKKGSLADLVRKNIKAFAPKKERAQVAGNLAGISLSSHRESCGDNVKTRLSSAAKLGDLDTDKEDEDEERLGHKRSKDRAGFGSGMGGGFMGKGLSGRLCEDDRSRHREGRLQRYRRDEEDAENEFEDGSRRWFLNSAAGDEDRSRLKEGRSSWAPSGGQHFGNEFEERGSRLREGRLPRNCGGSLDHDYENRSPKPGRMAGLRREGRRN